MAVEEWVHGPAFRRPFLVHRGFRIVEQRMVFRMAGGDVGGGDFGTDQRQTVDVLFPGIAKEKTDLLAGGIKHGCFRTIG